ncbi:X-ray radiation resistance-associated protein 1 isoform X5 [Dasypus novemcinctus]|uniref:X-ray radiation resistance-associated protein 1 isoform X5 n=1 Tax=Dasypus novemcinctus TaxID=9361 RepID=UPI002660123C|nr:X-ray radiation resistance-associated protein 1 isoform X3 [Dasypus novemcinctus]
MVAGEKGQERFPEGEKHQKKRRPEFEVKKQKKKEVKGTFPKSKIKEMTSSRIYKLDDGKPYLNNCFPAKSLLRMPEEAGRGHWLVARNCNLKKKPRGAVEASAAGQETQKKLALDIRRKKGSQQENQVDIPGFILDRAFLLKHHCVRKPSELCNINVSGLKFSKAREKDFKHFHSVIYINASENLLPLETFHTFPALKELELAFNGIKTVYVKYGDFKFLEFLDLSFNSLTAEAIYDLGILPHLRVLLLTGNGLTSLPPNLAVTEQEASLTTLTSKRYILRFPALETLMLDDNKLSNPSCFASLAGLRRLKKLSLEQNKISRIPYLQQVHLGDGSGDWVGGRGSPRKESQSTLQPKSWVFEASDGQPDYTVLPMKKDVDRTEVVFSSYPGFSTSQTTKVCALPPIFEILPVKSLKARNQTLAPPFPELRYLSLAYNKVKTHIPKVPKQPLTLRYPSGNTVKSPSKNVLEPEAEPAVKLPTAKSSSLDIEGIEGLSLPHRAFVPLPPICSDSTVHSEDTMSRPSDTAGHLSPEHLSDEDTKSTESVFLTQVSGLPSSVFQRNESEVEKDQRKPSATFREVKRARRKLPSASLPDKYHGYEELLSAKPDPDFTEPKGIQKNAQALQHMLRHPLLYRSSKPKTDAFQKPYAPKEKRTQRIPLPPPRKTRAQLLDDILIRMRDPRNITEAPLGAVLRRRAERRLVTQKQYLEAKRLLKEFRARYRRLVRGSMQAVFGPPPPAPSRPALSQGPPRFGRFLEFMDEFCPEPATSDSKG